MTYPYGLHNVFYIEDIWQWQMDAIWCPSGVHLPVAICPPYGKHMQTIWICHMETRWGAGCKPHQIPYDSHMAFTYVLHMGVI